MLLRVAGKQLCGSCLAHGQRNGNVAPSPSGLQTCPTHNLVSYTKSPPTPSPCRRRRLGLPCTCVFRAGGPGQASSVPRVRPSATPDPAPWRRSLARSRTAAAWYTSSCSLQTPSRQIGLRDFQDAIVFAAKIETFHSFLETGHCIEVCPARGLWCALAVTVELVTIMRAVGSDELAHPGTKTGCGVHAGVRAICLDSMPPQFAYVGPSIGQIAHASQGEPPSCQNQQPKVRDRVCSGPIAAAVAQRLAARLWTYIFRGAADKALRHHVTLRPAA